jgi:hypothetical protein
MTYHPHYLMQQMARGRPLPAGSPDPDLFRALEQLSALDMDRFIRQGGRPDACDPRGRTALHVLLDRAITPKGELTVSMERLISCFRVIVRQGCDTSRRHPVSGQTLLYRSAVLAGHPQATAWWHFLHGLQRGRWQEKGGRDLPSALEAWHAKASDEVRLYLPPLPISKNEESVAADVRSSRVSRP